MAKEDLAAEAAEKQEPAPRLASSFAELGICKELVEACDLMGWKEPTRIQAEAIPHALQGATDHPSSFHLLAWAVPGDRSRLQALLIRFGFAPREGPDRARADGVGEDGRVRAAHPAGAAREPRRAASFLRLRAVPNEVRLAFSNPSFAGNVSPSGLECAW